MKKVKIEKLTHFPSETPAQEKLGSLLEWAGITTETYSHPPIFTVEEGLALDLPNHIYGLHGKSLFLVTPHNQYWLVLVVETTRVDLKSLALKMGVKRFSFAKPDKMIELLGIASGSATPFALMTDEKRQVNVVIDKTYLNATHAVFHPLDNRFSTIIQVSDLIKFIEGLGYEPKICALA